MKQVITYLLITLSIFTLFTCKKYPQGGYHFNALKNLTEGVWKLKLYEVNGIDSTYLTQGANTIPNYIDDFARFGSRGRGKRTEIRLSNHYRHYSVSLYYKKRYLLGISEGNNSDFDSTGCHITNSQLCQRNIFIPINGRNFTWKIEKLTKKEMILISTTYNYKIILLKK